MQGITSSIERENTAKEMEMINAFLLCRNICDFDYTDRSIEDLEELSEGLRVELVKYDRETLKASGNSKIKIHY